MKTSIKMELKARKIKLISVFFLLLLSLIGFAQTYVEQGSSFITNYTAKEINSIGSDFFCNVKDNRGMVYIGNTNSSILQGMAFNSLERDYAGDSNDFRFLQPTPLANIKYAGLAQSGIDREINFKVREKNTYGAVGNAAEYQLTTSAPLHKTWLTFFTYLLVVILVIFVTIKIFTNRLREQKIKLESLVEERTKEIIEQAWELQIINEKLLEKDKFKQIVTSMIVHDLKNPINSIINAPDTEPTHQLKRIKHTGKQMLNLVTNILDVYKYEEAVIVLNAQNCKLFDIAQQAIESILFLSKEKNISISNRIRSKLSVNADIDMIERVFVNLLTNAIKYTPNNGNVIIDAKLLNENTDESFVKITITDNGIGIAPDKTHYIFQKFGQINAKNSGSTRPTGIGLTYCKMVVNAHLGIIDVETKLGEGSTFWFTLPGKAEDKIVSKKSTSTELYKPVSTELSFENQQIIQQYLPDLQKTEIYKITELNKIIEKINDLGINEIKVWKQTLINTIDSGNETLYKKLLNSGQIKQR